MAKLTAKITADQEGSDKPHKAPMAIPVKAEWPSASEKKDIRLWTTIVDSRPNRGVMTSTASRAFFIKNIRPGSAQSKGSRSTSMYQSSITRRLLSRAPCEDERSDKIPARPAPRPGSRSSARSG